MRVEKSAPDFYFAERHPKYFYEMHAWKRLRGVIDELPDAYRSEASTSLKKLHGEFFLEYTRIEVCVLALKEHGIFPSRERCIAPFKWLAADRGRVDHVETWLKAMKRTQRLRAIQAELRSTFESERARAEQSTELAIADFRKEFPTEHEQRRAIMVIAARRPDVFHGLDPFEGVGLKISISIWKQAIDADHFLRSGRGEGASDQKRAA